MRPQSPSSLTRLQYQQSANIGNVNADGSETERVTQSKSRDSFLPGPIKYSMFEGKKFTFFNSHFSKIYIFESNICFCSLLATNLNQYEFFIRVQYNNIF